MNWILMILWLDGMYDAWYDIVGISMVENVIIVMNFVLNWRENDGINMEMLEALSLRYEKWSMCNKYVLAEHGSYIYMLLVCFESMKMMM